MVLKAFFSTKTGYYSISCGKLRPDKHYLMEKLRVNHFYQSEEESKRFERLIVRCQIIDNSFNDLYKKVKDLNNSTVILRFPTSHLREFNSSKISELGAIFCDSLVYYKTIIDAEHISPLQNKLTFNKWNPLLRQEIDEMVGEIFSGYTNHYFSNPILLPSKIKAGYLEWMTNYVDPPEDTSLLKIGLFGELNQVRSSFATCEFNHKAKEGEGVLFGVLPKFSGQGIYTDLIREAKRISLQLDISEFYVSTQIQNVAVQKTWVREGFKIFNSYYTVHINLP